ncbi:leucine-rich repeat-containing protein 41 isoform X2 [Tiliqua scincoides]|uniref:leucine-rich repeat-containing protein 41 isoform X2 n=1 Tax=Tiliqua scincoides TaxID=71010 RepID=UPI0034628560
MPLRGDWTHFGRQSPPRVTTMMPLPGPILQGILPLLNIYYLERIEETAVKKGISTQPIWCKLWFDIIKPRSSRLESIKCWRKRFLETFFSDVLRGFLDVSSDQRLSDPCFLPLLHTSQHVTHLTFDNMLEEVLELMAKHNHRVLDNLTVSLRSLTFHHLLSTSPSTRQQLSLFLHRVIHHGAVNRLSMYSWPDPDSELLVLLLKMSAGVWHPGKMLTSQESLCHMCREKSVDWSQKPDQKHNPLLGSSQLFPKSTAGPCSDEDVRNKKELPNMSQESVPGFENAVEHARTSCKSLENPMNCRPGSSPSQSSMQNITSLESCNAKEGSLRTVQAGPSSGKSQKRLRAKHRSCQRHNKATTESEDLYDFLFAVAREEREKALFSQRSSGEEGQNLASDSPLSAEAASTTTMIGPDEAQLTGITALKSIGHFRSVSTLEVFSVPLTKNTCQMLGNLLSSWVSLEKLVLTLNGLGPNIVSILSGLQALSRHRNYSLRVVCISDTFAYVPCMNLVHFLLSTVPLLQMLLVNFDLSNPMEGNRPEEILGSAFLEEEIPESHLEHLEMRFPREPLHTSLLLPVLKASKPLQSLSLDSVAISHPEVGLLLQALKEYSPNLKSLSFHDVNLSGHSKEVLFLLQDPILQEITFSFCRLFENSTAEFLPEIINTVKKNSSLKSLKLPGNRLGNHRLVALADIFSEDSSSSICNLDVSSNCIKPDGLLEFAKKLESYVIQRSEQIKFTKLCLTQNWLDHDPIMAQEALQRLKAMCSVVSDTWASSQAFADYSSVM